MVDIQWLIGGEAGYGIMTTGVMMAKIFTRLGMSVFDYVEYPSLIRGGHNAYYVRACDAEIFSQKRPVDILVALNRETIDRHKSELSQNAAVIYDSNITKAEGSEFSPNINLIPIPLLELTKQTGADKLMINTVAVGASLGLFYSDFSVLEKIMTDAFGRKGEKVVLENVNTSKAGFDYVQKNFPKKSPFAFQKKEQENLLISGAEAVSFGAIKAGLKFAAIYPMTPINAILATLVQNALKYNIVVKEPEDEIAGINMAIGASFAGARSMVATSGGGFALMVEGLGLAAQTETPLVVVEGQRPGPATGLPTWTDQGDLNFVLHAAHGDFPRIVVAPGDPLEAFEQTMQAFNLAEKYQLQVIVLVDKYLMEGHTTVQSSKFKVQSESFKIERGKILSDQEVQNVTAYKRYELVEDGVSARSLPGQKGGIALNGSDEHDEFGHYNETSENRVKMMDKRFKKLEGALVDIPSPDFFGEKDALLTILSFGSTKMPVLEAINWLKKDGINVNFLKASYVSPFPKEIVASAIKSAKKTLVVENNKTGQFERLIKEQTGLSVDNHFRKYDGRPFYPEEIVEKVKAII
ncbi:MAG: 2-oxoacid:acceptor oxidoreductase subunit alpha [Candidatus Levybacteria bacterium]|nr:2-oxoacid:acceptor oxidoreductase subunit alpha [Candidatus Levybacteria bacterium]